jgi:DNA-binding transcriptional MerR regulator
MTAPQRAGQRSAAAARPAAKAPAKSAAKHEPKASQKPEPHVDTVSRRLEKSPAAFRTISEVAEELDVPQHVLRFWESKFPQVRPLKRGGGRRYYRPEDVDLLGRIRQLLYKDGYTIKGVQRLMREGALKAKRETAHEAAPDAGAEPGEALDAAADTAADGPLGPLDAEARAELQGLLSELLALRADLRRLTG